MAAIKRKGSRVSVMHNDGTGVALYPAVSLGTEARDGKRYLRLLLRLGKGSFRVISIVDNAALRDQVGVPPEYSLLRSRWERSGLWDELNAEAARRDGGGGAP